MCRWDKRADFMSQETSPSPDIPRINETLRTTYWVWNLYSPAEGPSHLLELLQRNLPHVAAHSWPERFDFGGVYVNGREALVDQPLPFPCKVEYYEPKFEIRDAHSIFPAFEERFIVYSDEAVAVVYKPPRLSSMPAKEQRHFSLKASLERHFGTHVHMPSRLDVSAQGLVVVSISPQAHKHLQQAFESRDVDKTYLLATSHDVAWTERTVSLPIGRDSRHPVLRSTQAPHGQAALTHFSRMESSLSRGQACTVLKASPVTGRTHQIRVHAASQGIPILGDNFYGGYPSDHLHLVSAAIEFRHPIRGERCACSLPSSLRPEWLRTL